MPIRAASDQGDVHAFMLDAEQWSTLKATYKGLNLRMPCCGVAAIPKTSQRGNYFFAHERRGECVTADESSEHLYCKSLIAKAALDAGWSVTTERHGVTPTGEQWIADVFCERGEAQIALEVQMSPQSDDETIRRQKRYQASGVRGAWFFGAKAHKGALTFGRETPAFSLEPVVVGASPKVKSFNVSLPDFVVGMLQKRLAWTIPQYSRPHYVEFIEDICWSCKRPVRQIFDHVHGDHAPDGEVLTMETVHEGRWHEPAYTVAGLSNLIEKTHAVVTNEELIAQGLNPIGRRDAINGRPTRFPYCNLCRHCRAPQNNFHLSQRIYSELNKRDACADEGFFDEILKDDVTLSHGISVFGLAMIPRTVFGSGFWDFQERHLES